MALDADAAGAKATLRSLQVARDTLDRELDIRFDAHNLVRYESRLEADIRVVTMPEGKDPDNIIREDPTQWPLLLAKAKPVVDYVIGVLTQDLDMTDAKAKTAVAQQIIPLIEDITNPVERDQYWHQLAYALKVDEKSLRQLRGGGKRPFPQQQSRPSHNIPEPPQPSPELDGLSKMRSSAAILDPAKATQMREVNLLSQSLHHPKTLNDINTRLAEAGQPPITQADFIHIEDRELFEQLRRRANHPLFVSIDELCDSLESPLLERVQHLRTLPPTPEPELDRLADKLVLSIIDIRIEKTKQLSAKIKDLVIEAETSGEVESYNEYKSQLVELTRQLWTIQQAKNAMSAVSKRRAEEASLDRY